MGLRGPGSTALAKARRKAVGKRERRRAWQKRGLSRAERVIAFVEGLRLTAGRFAGKRLKLRAWQRAMVTSIYRVDRRGRRIVRQVLASMGRKNGKTQLAAALALAHLAGPEAEPRGEVYSAASDRNQAGRVFRELESFITADADLSARCNVQRFAKRIEVLSGPGAGSVYEALSSDARKAHSLSPSMVVCDELAQWPARELYDNLVTGTGARDEPLVIVISTQSPDPHHVMSELVKLGEQVRDGVIDDPSFLPIIYTVPPDASPWDETVWHLANPALGDFRSLEELRKFAATARRIPAREAVFRNLYLNQAIDVTSEGLISGPDWDACAGAVDADALAGRPCWGGLDLSSTRDLTAFVLYFPEDGGAVLAWFWLPGDTLIERAKADRIPYDLWRRDRLIEAHSGRAVDKRAVAGKLAELAARFDIRGIGFDRWRMADLQKLLSDEGIDLPLKDFGQGFQSMAPAIEAMEEAVLQGRIRHGGHPVLRWNMANARAEPDAAGNRKISKAKSTGRVDGVVALAMAIGLHAREPAPVVYDFDRPLVLSV